MTRKPAQSPTTIGVFPIACAQATVVAIASGLDFAPRITSTRGIRGTGLKKCIPQKFSGAFSASASRVIESVDVFDARIVPGFTLASSSARTDFLTFSFSTTASTTMSTEPKSPKERVGVIPARTCAIFPAVILPRSTCFSRSLAASPIPSSSAFGAMSFIRIGVPFDADW